jgi:leukocyte immunoglobulin-like receptor
LEAQEYLLYKEETHKLWNTQTPLEPWKKAMFSIESTTGHHAGRYHCYYWNHAVLSKGSEALEVVVTGERPLRGHS